MEVDQDCDVSMPSRASTSLLLDITAILGNIGRMTCQCPHGLVPHCYSQILPISEIKYILCQCPHGLVPHCYEGGYYYAGNQLGVSMPSRASTSLLRVLSFARTYEGDL